MPNFTWDISPIAVAFPKDYLLTVVGAIATLMLVFGLIKKQSDMSIFGLFLLCISIGANYILPDEIGIRYYSLLFVGVFLGGYALLNWQIQRGGGPVETAGDFIVYGVLGVLIGSRLGHVLFYDLDKAIDDPLWVLQIWTGGLASHGAVVGLIVAMWLFTKTRGVPFLEGADRFSFSAALGATLVRVGNFFNSEIVGRIVEDQSWGVRFPRSAYDQGLLEAPLRYPTQLFEVALGLGVLFSLWLTDRLLGKEKRPRGALISVFFLTYFAGRFTVEFWKEYQTLETTSVLTMGQYLSIPGFIIGVVGLIWSLQAKAPVGWHEKQQGNKEETSPARPAYDPDVESVLDGDDEEEEVNAEAPSETETQEGNTDADASLEDEPAR
ncbi:MAG: prolipoprotein diacylglyceryl transferase [Polyangiaceae bacterium]|nr:prolipoprotein diacylglyceryl transferase [Polyangiaceae bacterium]